MLFDAFCSAEPEISVIFPVYQEYPLKMGKHRFSENFQINLTETPVNENEKKLADTIEDILIQSINKYTGIEVVEDETLDFQTP